MTTNTFDMKDSSLGQWESWEKFTLSSDSDGWFNSFRRHPTMIQAVEGTPLLAGIQNLLFFKKNPECIIASIIDKISGSDSIGAPLHQITSTFRGSNLVINPTTLRYCKNIQNYIDLFGIDFLLNSTVCEIGAGYGGEAKVFFDFKHSFNNISNSSNYFVFDLSSSYDMISRFLSYFNYKVSFANLNDFSWPANSNSFVISNGALSEMRGGLLNEYIHKVVLPADKGYFIVNFDTHSKPYKGGISNIDFYNLLEKHGKNPFFLESSRFLTYWDSPSSKVICFGSNREAILKSSKQRKLSYTNLFFILILSKLYSRL